MGSRNLLYTSRMAELDNREPDCPDHSKSFGELSIKIDSTVFDNSGHPLRNLNVPLKNYPESIESNLKIIDTSHLKIQPGECKLLTEEEPEEPIDSFPISPLKG